MAFSLGVFVDAAARKFGLYPYCAPRKYEALAAATTTLDNLKAVYSREENARQRYLAFAKKADEEGIGKLASLFRAAAKSKEFQVRNHAEAIEKCGGTPSASAAAPEVKSIRENLDAAIKFAKDGAETLYPSLLGKARDEGNKDAMKTFNYAKSGEEQILKFFLKAKETLDQWKGGGREFFVCPTCSYTVAKIDFAKCIVCFTLGEKYIKVT